MAATVRTCLRRLPTICSALRPAPMLPGATQGRTYTVTSQNSIVKPRAFCTSSSRFSSQQSEQCYNFHIQDEDDFQDRVINSKTPTVVDFHADWCGPCRLLGPKLEKFIDEHEGKILLAKVDIDELSDIAMKYNVKVVPTVVGIKEGKGVAKFEGNLPDKEITDFLNKLLLK